jgi:hypothetical protein
MTIRFLQTVDSEIPGYPFTAGQVITVPAPSPRLIDLLSAGLAEAVSDDCTERAEAPAAARPEPVSRRGRRRARVA